jgi:capsular polysaccharide biosynthesis protein
LTFTDFVRLIRRGLWLIVLLTILGTATGALASRLQPTMYETSATLLVTAVPQASAADGQGANLLAQSRAQLLSQLALSDSVLSRAAETLDSRATLDELRSRVTASSVESSNFTTISASAPTAQLAVQTVEAVVSATQDVGESLDTATRAGTALPSIRITEVTPAPVPARAYSPQPRNATIAGAAVGLALALIILSLREVLSQRVRGANDIRALDLGFPVAVIQRSAAIRGRRQGSATIESYRYLRSTLLHALGRRGVVAITSVSSRSSAADLGTELGRAIFEVGFSVLVIDARLTGNRVRVRTKDSRPEPAGTRRSVRDAAKETQLVRSESDVTVVRFEDLSPDAAALVEQRGQQALADTAFTGELRERSRGFDYAVLLLPSMADCAEAAVAAAGADAAVLQIDASTTKRGEVLLAHQRLRASGVKEIVGAVVGAARMDVLPSTPGL